MEKPMERSFSDRKVTANRENSKKSTGPRTARGKAIASLNALTHGVFAKRTVALGPPLLEEPAQFIAILESLRAHWEPVGILEDVKVQEIASINWKKVRLERYETAGIAERLSATVAAARSRVTDERWGSFQKGISAGSNQDRNLISAAELREQIDLVDRLRHDNTKIEEEPDFLAFVWLEKFGETNDATLSKQNKPEELKKLLAELPPQEIEDLKERFRANAQGILEGMWELRAKTVPDEAALERSLIPDEAEMNLIMRYAAHLIRLEEKTIALLERLQAERRRKEGRIR